MRVTPKASRNEVRADEDGNLRILVTAVPENGKATDAARKLLARHLEVAPSRLVLVQGAQSRTKTFRLD